VLFRSKPPRHGYPEWVMQYTGEVKRYRASNGLLRTDLEDGGTAAEGDVKPACEWEVENLDVVEGPPRATIAERVARCGKQGVVLFEDVEEEVEGGELVRKAVFVARWVSHELHEVGELLGFEVAGDAREVLLLAGEGERLLSEWGRDGMKRQRLKCRGLARKRVIREMEQEKIVPKEGVLANGQLFT